MSTCILNSGMSLGCRSTGGGTVAMWLSTFSASTAWSATTDGTLTASTGYNTFYKFEAPQGVISVTEEEVGNTENYNVAITQTITSSLMGISQTEANLIALMGQYPLFCITKHSNGSYYLFGYENGVWMNQATRSFGKAKTDGVMISFTLTGAEDVMAPVVSAALVASLGLS